MTCQWCEGHGHFISDNGPAPVEEVCEVCEGTGIWDLVEMPIELEEQEA